MLVKNKWNNKIYEVLEINQKDVVLKREDNTTFTINTNEYVFSYRKLEKTMSESEMKNIIQNAIKHWLKPNDSGVLAFHYEEKRILVDIEWSDGVSIFDCGKVLALIKKKRKVSKDDLYDFCST